MAKPNSKTKEEKDADFIAYIEQVLGFPLVEWQKPFMMELRNATAQGRPVNITLPIRRKL